MFWGLCLMPRLVCMVFVADLNHHAHQYPKHPPVPQHCVGVLMWSVLQTSVYLGCKAGSVGSKADIKSQNTLLQLNKSLVLIVLCCLRC